MSEPIFEYETLEGIKEEFQILRKDLVENNPNIDETHEVIVAIDTLIHEIDSVDGVKDFTLTKKVTIKALTFFVGQLLGFDEAFDDDDGDDDLDVEELEAFLNDFSSSWFSEKDKELLFLDDEKEFLLQPLEEEDQKPVKKPAKENPPKKKPGRTK